jgi:MFS family permease
MAALPPWPVVVRGWTLGMGIVVMACSGTLYAYSVYASDYCRQLGYTATESSVIVGLGDAGLYLSGVASGWLVDVYGVRTTALLSAVLMTGGYLGMAYTYTVRECTCARACVCANAWESLCRSVPCTCACVCVRVVGACVPASVACVRVRVW